MKIEGNFDAFAWDFGSSVTQLSGMTRFLRLATIYNNSPSNSSIRGLAGAALVEALLASSCTGFRSRVTGDVSVFLASPQIINWEHEADLRMAGVLSVLEQELHQAKSSAIKDTIRSSYFNLSLHYIQWGRIEDALKNLMKSREFASSSQHHIDISLRLVSCYLDLGQLVNAASFCTKIHDLAQDTATLLRAKALLGLLSLQERSYSSSATRFLALDGDIGADWSFLFSASDVGFYGAVSALLAQSRPQIIASLAQNKLFQAVYLVDQPEIKNLIGGVYERNDYRSVVPFLRWLHARLTVDVHLHKSAADIVQSIQDRLFAQYLEPFASVTLQRLADDFELDVATEIRPTLVELVTSHKVAARLDFRNGRILRGAAASSSSASPAQRRKQLLAKMMQVQEHHIANLKRSLLLLSMRKAGVIVDHQEQKGGQRDDAHGHSRTARGQPSRPVARSGDDFDFDGREDVEDDADYRDPMADPRMQLDNSDNETGSEA